MYYTIFAKREENFLAKIDVAPLAGARIEMYPRLCTYITSCVAPLAGARIEIAVATGAVGAAIVAPLAGARIEIPVIGEEFRDRSRRSPRGSAD